MNTKLAASLLVAGAFMLPVPVHGADSDSDRSSPRAFVKDSLITAEIKAKLAEEKLSTLIHVRVDTDDKGAVTLGGTAASKEAAAKAVSIARAVKGVTSVKNSIRVAGAASAASAASASSPVAAGKGSAEDRVEARIKDMHAKLKITSAQTEQWNKVAQVMRDNAKSLDALTQARFEHAKTMTAVEDLKSYGVITDAHADAIKKFTPVFATLYTGMSDAQKKDADDLFRHGGGRSKMPKVG